MKKLLTIILAAAFAALSFAPTVSAGTHCSRYDTGAKSCNTAKEFPKGDPIPATPDEGLGGGNGGGN